MRAKPRLAVFDFDGTITRRDTLLPWLWHITHPVTFFYQLLLCSPKLMAYLFGAITNEEAKDHLLTRFLRGRNLQTLRRLSSTFIRKKLPSLLRPAALEQLKRHRKAGDTCILISASPDLYVAPWGEHQNFDYVITTLLEYNKKTVTGGLHGKNCYGPEKVRRLKEHIPHPERCHLIVYGDSVGDRELLELADEPHYRPFR